MWGGDRGIIGEGGYFSISKHVALRPQNRGGLLETGISVSTDCLLSTTASQVPVKPGC